MDVKIGLDFIKNYKKELYKKNIGIITNNSARDQNLNSTLSIIKNFKDVNKLTLLTPEHGYFGDFQAGIAVSSNYDNEFNINTVSLYRGENNKNDNIDEKMRETDSKNDSSKYIPDNILKDFDIILYDLNDIGCRIYTYISTLIYTIEKLNDKQKIIIMDRPNPITGLNPEGPLLKENLKSFIGSMPIPIKHSLTIGEIALYYNKFIDSRNIEVIKMENWKRNLLLDETNIPWIMPSPNMPTLDTALIYPGNVLFEGTNVSEGRGTTKPFQIIGAPWINGTKLKNEINSLKIPGVKVMEFKFRPTFSKYENQLNYGIYIYISDKKLFKPFNFSLNVISKMIELYDEFQFYDPYFDKTSGDKKIREMLKKLFDPDEIEEKFKDEIINYQSKTEEIKLY